MTDRKGQDMCYAIDLTKIHNELGSLPETKIEDDSRRLSNGSLKIVTGGKKS